MTKTNSTTLCGLVLLLSASFISIHSWAEQTKIRPHTATINTTAANTSMLKTSRAGPDNQDFNTKSDLGFRFANQLLSAQNKRHSLTPVKTNLAETRKQGITVSVNTLMKPTNLPGRYLGKSKVMLVHY